MPSIVLKLSHAPSHNEEHEARRGAGPLFRSTGDIDYLCGNCGFVIASGMAPSQLIVFRYEDQGVAVLEDGLYTSQSALADPAMVDRLARYKSLRCCWHRSESLLRKRVKCSR